MKSRLLCESCDAEYSTSEARWRCDCGGVLTLDFSARFPIKKIKERKPTLWRYREALPITDKTSIVTFEEGFTPLVEEDLFGNRVLLKQDHLFPSGSYKDRGATVLVSKIKELGVQKVVEDSSGNAGAAIAAYCAKASVDCHVYAPEKTSPGKLLQIKRYGAHLHLVKGNREDTAEGALHQAQRTYYASHYWNPFFFHGTKTCVLEIVEQLCWQPPDVLIVPVGNGTLLIGTYLGLTELQQDDRISAIPKIIGVQAGLCAPLASAWEHQGMMEPCQRTKQTIAEGIAIPNPLRAKEILHAVKETKGAILAVNEQEILEALRMMHRKGYYIEPTSAVAVAAVKKIRFTHDDRVVIPLTGHGLKTTRISS